MSLSLNTTNSMNSLLFSHNRTGGVGEISYSPFGGRDKYNHLPVGFNGQRADPVSQYYHLGNGVRAYNPILMRFNTPDNLSPFGAGGINPYAYCLGDPINRSDPSGHISVLGTTTSIIGLVLGALSIFAGGAGLATIAFSLTSLLTGVGSVALEITSSTKMDSRPADAKDEQNSAATLGMVSAAFGVLAMFSTMKFPRITAKKTVVSSYKRTNTSSLRSTATQTEMESRAMATQTEGLGSQSAPAMPQPDYPTTPRSSVVAPTPPKPVTAKRPTRMRAEPITENTTGHTSVLEREVQARHERILQLRRGEVGLNVDTKQGEMHFVNNISENEKILTNIYTNNIYTKPLN